MQCLVESDVCMSSLCPSMHPMNLTSLPAFMIHQQSWSTSTTRYNWPAFTTHQHQHFSAFDSLLSLEFKVVCFLVYCGVWVEFCKWPSSTNLLQAVCCVLRVHVHTTCTHCQCVSCCSSLILLHLFRYIHYQDRILWTNLSNINTGTTSGNYAWYHVFFKPQNKTSHYWSH